MSIGIIVQARMGSTRLPGKVLLKIGGLPLLGHVLGRLGLSRHKLTTVVATTSLPEDDVIIDFCMSNEADCFRGSAYDVLDRYYQCALQKNFKHIVRLTADNPFTDIEELDHLIYLHLKEGNAFTHSFGRLPIGLGAEIFTFDALQKSWENGQASHHREHVDEYILENPFLFKTGVLDIPASKSSPHLRLTVDTSDDWRIANELAKKIEGGWLTTEQLIKLCLDFV